MTPDLGQEGIRQEGVTARVTDEAETAPSRESFIRILLIFLRLGLTSFGGPIAHIGYLREEFVARRRWIGEQSFADLVALAQFIPGPASSQTGFAIGVLRGGLPGGVAAWLGFTMPSALVMTLAAYGVDLVSSGVGAGAVHGLKLVAVAVVAQAVWGMAGHLCPDRTRATIAVLATLALLAVPSTVTQIGVILAGAAVGIMLLRGGERRPPTRHSGSACRSPLGSPLSHCSARCSSDYRSLPRRAPMRWP